MFIYVIPQHIYDDIYNIIIAKSVQMQVRIYVNLKLSDEANSDLF